MYIIKEYSEFSFQRMNSDSTPMAMHVDNPNLSFDAFDKHIDNVRSSIMRLNSILNTLSSTGGIYKMGMSKISDGLDIKDLKILRIFQSNDIDIDVYISFYLLDKEYYGVIKNFLSNNAVLDTEAFRDTYLFPSKEWKIRISGLLIKAIRKWMRPSVGNYKCLKTIYCTSYETGEFTEIPKGTIIEYIRTIDNLKHVIGINDTRYILKGENFYYFNYFFSKK